MAHRAYTLLHVKEIDDDQRIIEGVASTPRTDRMEDIVESEGAVFKLPVPLLWQHDKRSPVGHVTQAQLTKEGISVRAQFAKTSTPGKLKERLDEAWESVKLGLVRGLSIGFNPLEWSEIKGTFGLRFTKWEWLELSAVTIPANIDASITAVKSADEELRAALGNAQPQSPGASGTVKLTKPKPRGKAMAMTIAERIGAFEAKRAANVARMQEITDDVGNEGRTKDASEQEEFDTLKAEIKSVDQELKDLRDMEALNVKAAKPAPANPQGQGLDARPTRVSVKAPHAAPGVRLARAMRCKFIAVADSRDVTMVARELYPDDHLVEKAVVGAGTSTHETWAGPLVGDESGAFADFVEWLRPLTILGRLGTNGIPGLRRVSFRRRLVSQTSGGSGYWVGEGKPKPMTKFDFAGTTLEPAKVANIAIVTMETLRDSSPSAEIIVRDQLAEALVERMDTDFVDPDKAVAAGVSPASITNGIAGIASTGNDGDAVRTDIKNLFAPFLTARNPPRTGVLLMPSTTALAVSLMQNPLGQPEFPGFSMNGGNLFGLSALVSDYVPSDEYGSIVVLMNASDVYFADEGGIDIDLSREASVEMLDSDLQQDGAAGTGASLVSLWQNNLVGFKAERTLNWSKRRSTAVQYLTGVNWGAPSA